MTANKPNNPETLKKAYEGIVKISKAYEEQLQKAPRSNCPPGMHSHNGREDCHPIDTKHRGMGGPQEQEQVRPKQHDNLYRQMSNLAYFRPSDIDKSGNIKIDYHHVSKMYDGEVQNFLSDAFTFINSKHSKLKPSQKKYISSLIPKKIKLRDPKNEKLLNEILEEISSDTDGNYDPKANLNFLDYLQRHGEADEDWFDDAEEFISKHGRKQQEPEKPKQESKNSKLSEKEIDAWFSDESNSKVEELAESGIVPREYAESFYGKEKVKELENRFEREHEYHPGELDEDDELTSMIWFNPPWESGGPGEGGDSIHESLSDYIDFIDRAYEKLIKISKAYEEQLQKAPRSNCPPGQHAHQGRSDCHPIDTKHRGQGGGETVQPNYKPSGPSTKIPEGKKPVVRLIGEDGNIYSILGNASRALKDAGFREEAKEMINRAVESDSYDKAISIVLEYVTESSAQGVEAPSVNLDEFEDDGPEDYSVVHARGRAFSDGVVKVLKKIEQYDEWTNSAGEFERNAFDGMQEMLVNNLDNAQPKAVLYFYDEVIVDNSEAREFTGSDYYQDLVSDVEAFRADKDNDELGWNLKTSMQRILMEMDTDDIGALATYVGMMIPSKSRQNLVNEMAQEAYKEYMEITNSDSFGEEEMEEDYEEEQDVWKSDKKGDSDLKKAQTQEAYSNIVKLTKNYAGTLVKCPHCENLHTVKKAGEYQWRQATGGKPTGMNSPRTSCPPGQHAHQGRSDCHPIDTKHRGMGGPQEQEQAKPKQQEEKPTTSMNETAKQAQVYRKKRTLKQIEEWFDTRAEGAMDDLANIPWDLRGYAMDLFGKEQVSKWENEYLKRRGVLPKSVGDSDDYYNAWYGGGEPGSEMLQSNEDFINLVEYAIGSRKMPEYYQKERPEGKLEGGIEASMKDVLRRNPKAAYGSYEDTALAIMEAMWDEGKTYGYPENPNSTQQKEILKRITDYLQY